MRVEVQDFADFAQYAEHAAEQQAGQKAERHDGQFIAVDEFLQQLFAGDAEHDIYDDEHDAHAVDSHHDFADVFFPVDFEDLPDQVADAKADECAYQDPKRRNVAHDRIVDNDAEQDNGDDRVHEETTLQAAVEEFAICKSVANDIFEWHYAKFSTSTSNS